MEMFSSKTLIYFRLEMDILDDMGVSKLSANFFLKVNYSFNVKVQLFKAKKR